MSDINVIDNIEYSNIQKPSILTGMTISKNSYQYDENGNLIQPDALINAVDINWGGAKIDGLDSLNTTSQLLNYISDIHQHGGGHGVVPDIDNNTVIGMMLSCIRALQAEVVKLRNSFVEGIYSCTGKQTKMSATNYSLNDIDAEEPLWAIDENTLSEVLYVDLTTKNLFDHNDNIEVNIENNTLTFLDEAFWNDSENIIENVVNPIISPSIQTTGQDIVAMPKIYVYLKTTGLDITFYLRNIEDENDVINISLNDLFNSNDQDLYNILFVLATSIKEEKNDVIKYYGKNFCWIQIGHYIYDGIQQGYYNNVLNRIQDSEFTFGNNRYVLKSIRFNNLTLSKMNFYTKYQNFSNEVDSINPDYDTRYKTAHITIRSIDSYEDLLEIKDQLPENELIYVEQINTLYIKNGYKLKKIGSSGEGGTPEPEPENPDIETMTNKELLTALKQMGIVYEHYSENADTQDYDLQLAALDSVTFIHQDTGKKFDISIDAYGKLKSVEQGNIESLKERVGENVLNNIMNKNSVRGFVANIRASESNKNAGDASDLKLLADRVKIGAIYAPLDSEETFGCSHAYVELENTSDKDFPLENCYLHYCKWNNITSSYNVYHLALDGYIPAGGTYLIRGKKYINADKDASVFIYVDSYDKEWYVDGELIDFTMNDERDAVTHSWAFALTYGNSSILETSQLYEKGTDNNVPTGETKDKYVFIPGFIDSIAINTNSGCQGWAAAAFTQTKNCIYKNTFELDPAKQAFNGLHSKDSSRVRWQNMATDGQYVILDKDIIEFPHSELIKDVKDYTPKASFENKNVCTDKTQFDVEKPNMTTVSFGIDAFRTRCFNWISGGNFDEYVFIKKEDGTWDCFESYKQRKLTHIAETYYSDAEINNHNSTLDGAIHAGDIKEEAFEGIHWTQSEIDAAHEGDPAYGKTVEEWKEEPREEVLYTEAEANAFNLTLVGAWTSNTIKTPASDYDKEYEAYIENTTKYPIRKEYSYDVCNIAYCGFKDTIKVGKRVTSTFPASNIFYTSHKCIIDILSENEANNLTEPKQYTYVVGRINKLGNGPDLNHCSKEMHFTMYPKTYKPRVYQTTDQQGFHWIEYQVWAAAAIKLNDMINEESTNDNIIPVLVNTGDMTQSGARINEWLDYYKAGECLFEHLEQMNIVGNNDLCGTDPTILGTGDDPGKSNGYFYYICYCYDIPNDRNIDIENNKVNIAPIINNVIIPSLYYFDFDCNENGNTQKYRMCMVNSEITLTNCKEWFGLGYGSDYTANIYTGFAVKNKFTDSDNPEQTYLANILGFTPIYTILYYMLNCHKEDDTTKYLVYCHEMPFTVVTHANIAIGKCGIPRSVNGNNKSGSSMVGSKLNHIVWYENKLNKYTKGLHWFSRLLEYKGIKVCIGGHKHTYCVTYPLREYYKYNDTNSLISGPMVMTDSLENDSCDFVWNETINYGSETIVNDKAVDHTKFPLTYRDDVGITNENTLLYPYTYVNDEYASHAVIYFMCQATGYKLTSNKELPTKLQKFTNVLPETNNTTEKPNNNQKYPMFAVYELDSSEIKIRLGRIHEIFNDTAHTFTQTSFSKNDMYISYMIRKGASNDYGKWQKESTLNGNLYIFDPIAW